MSRSYIKDPKLSEAEIERIWENTKRWKTADSEVAVLFDLAEGLKKSGYKYNTQTDEEQKDSCFVLLDRNNVGDALEILCSNIMINRLGTGCSMLKNYKKGDPAFGIRLNGEEYRDGGLGFHPSSILKSQDLIYNPELIVLLIGEISELSYYSGKIKTDHKNREIIIEKYCDYIDHKSKIIPPIKRRNLSESEALNLAAKTAFYISSLSSLEKRSEHSYDLSMIDFDFEKNIGGELSLVFDNPYLTIDGKPLYEIGAINQTLIKMRSAQNRLDKLKGNQRAQEQINEGILKHEKDLASGEGAYFPMFKILN